jgi:hypothetical protein
MELSIPLDYASDPRPAAEDAAVPESAGLDDGRVAACRGFRRSGGRHAERHAGRPGSGPADRDRQGLAVRRAYAG